ncbi:MAG: WG repeat-containing protein [Cyanobacteria bacterium SIG31]|nr:WG repeat-containing protein [Cyanobacteria bacterium SIG31]
MKKFRIVFLFLSLILSYNAVEARCYAHYHHYSTPAYVVRSDYFENEQNFLNCEKHYLLTKTTVNFYSNGTRRTYNSYTAFNNDGTVVLSDCADIQHVIFNKKHYFLFKRDGRYQIATAEGEIFAKRRYSKMKEISNNRILVRVDKKYGVIDLNEDIIVPIKYKSFEKANNSLYLTKLNGYYGLMDSSGKLILKNEYEKIKPVYDTFLLKKYGKYGLADMDGEIILETECDKIKKMDEYIVTKKNGKYRVYDATGKILSDIEYKKVRVERNTLEGKMEKGGYKPILLQTL